MKTDTDTGSRRWELLDRIDRAITKLHNLEVLSYDDDPRLPRARAAVTRARRALIEHDQIQMHFEPSTTGQNQ